LEKPSFFAMGSQSAAIANAIFSKLSFDKRPWLVHNFTMRTQ
jgi:hypothetical protein